MKIRSLAWAVLVLAIITGAAYGEGKVADTADQAEPLGVGDKVPDIVLKDTEGKDFGLLESLAEKPAAIIFFRGGW